MEELEREYGIADSIKLASNENPLGPSPMAIEAIQSAMPRLNRYPDGSGHDLIRKISDHLGVSPRHIVLGNGSDEIIGMLAFALLQPGDEAVLPNPSFLMYDIMARGAGAVPIFVPLTFLAIDLDLILERITPKTRIIFLCNPNNPTGTIITKND
ncbi:MAG: aminotransferase class I/II-fold pyridoxal phosphate-dependent enzyme, partial [Desulfobacterales bacterium]